ncbi:MAG: DUF2203 domain-containing protein [Planctomycetes bacterium]|nr:DUF2203 domain-containing protein [Planctomycetota bacterium]
MESRIISIDEANRMLPLLRRIMRDITTHWERIIFKRTELECLEKDTAARTKNEKPIQMIKGELNYLIDKINHYIKEVEELGCFVEEFKRGIANFPTLYHGRKVFLCWKTDEDSVGFWHELDEGFNDRVRIRDPKAFLCHKPPVVR